MSLFNKFILLSQINAVLFVVSISWAANPLELELEDFIEIAIKHNPEIEIAIEQHLGGKGVLTQSRSLYYPRFTAEADLGRANLEDLSPVDEDTFAHGLLRATQLIYDFGRTTGLIDSSRFKVDASTENLKQVSQDVVFGVKANFYSVLEKQRLISVAEQAVDNYMQQLHRAKKYYEAGVRAKIDVINAEVNLAAQKLNLLRANADLKTAHVDLEKIIGQQPNNGNYILITDEPQLSDLAESKPKMPNTMQNLLITSKESRPGLKKFTYLMHSAESTLIQAKGDYWPSINALGDYNEYETDLESLRDQWQISVGLTWEFFSGFETEGKVAEAGALLREVRAALREYDLRITKEVTDSYLRADENREGVDLANQALQLAEENLRLADGRYKSGLGDLLEFNDAVLLLTQNQSSLVINYYNFLTELARIERAIGIIPELAGYKYPQ